MPLPDFIFQFLGFFFFLLSFLVPAGHGALEREAPGMCSLSRYQCLPSLGRQEIPQIHDFFFSLFPSFIVVFQNGPVCGSFSP